MLIALRTRPEFGLTRELPIKKRERERGDIVSLAVQTPPLPKVPRACLICQRQSAQMDDGEKEGYLVEAGAVMSGT